METNQSQKLAESLLNNESVQKASNAILEDMRRQQNENDRKQISELRKALIRQEIEDSLKSKNKGCSAILMILVVLSFFL